MEEELSKYDTQQLQRARTLINKVYEYNYKPSGQISRKLNTIIKKLDALIPQEGRTYKSINPKFLVNIGDCTSRFVCTCGDIITVKHDSGIMDNNDAPNFCKNCGEQFDWSDEDE